MEYIFGKNTIESFVESKMDKKYASKVATVSYSRKQPVDITNKQPKTENTKNKNVNKNTQNQNTKKK